LCENALAKARFSHSQGLALKRGVEQIAVAELIGIFPLVPSLLAHTGVGE
jgi:hypothetical protein